MQNEDQNKYAGAKNSDEQRDGRIFLKRSIHGNFTEDDLNLCDKQLQNVKKEIIKILLKPGRFYNPRILSKRVFILNFKGKFHGRLYPSPRLDIIYTSHPPFCTFGYSVQMVKKSNVSAHVGCFERFSSQFKIQFLQLQYDPNS